VSLLTRFRSDEIFSDVFITDLPPSLRVNTVLIINQHLQSYSKNAFTLSILIYSEQQSIF